MRKKLVFLLLVSVILILSGCTNAELKKTEKVEAFISNTLPQEEGEFKKVNSQTIMTGEGATLQVEMRIIQDYYNEEGEYIGTHLIHSTPEEGDNIKALNEPLTIQLPESFSPEGSRVPSVTQELRGEEEEKVRTHILNVFEDNY